MKSKNKKTISAKSARRFLNRNRHKLAQLKTSLLDEDVFKGRNKRKGQRVHMTPVQFAKKVRKCIKVLQRENFKRNFNPA